MQQDPLEFFGMSLTSGVPPGFFLTRVAESTYIMTTKSVRLSWKSEKQQDQKSQSSPDPLDKKTG